MVLFGNLGSTTFARGTIGALHYPLPTLVAVHYPNEIALQAVISLLMRIAAFSRLVSLVAQLAGITYLGRIAFDRLEDITVMDPLHKLRDFVILSSFFFRSDSIPTTVACMLEQCHGNVVMRRGWIKPDLGEVQQTHSSIFLLDL